MLKFHDTRIQHYSLVIQWQPLFYSGMVMSRSFISPNPNTSCIITTLLYKHDDHLQKPNLTAYNLLTTYQKEASEAIMPAPKTRKNSFIYPIENMTIRGKLGFFCTELVQIACVFCNKLCKDNAILRARRT